MNEPAKSLETKHRPIAEHLTERVNAALKTSAAEDMTVLEPENLSRLILSDATKSQASDIHLDPYSVGVRIRLRIDGVLHDAAILPHEHGQRLIRYFKTRAGLDPGASFLPHDSRCRFDLETGSVDVRLALVPAFGGEKLALRLLDQQHLQHRIQELGLTIQDEQKITGWIGSISGICLVTGPTGSGKTTTLYALLHELRFLSKSIVTIEDPVEYQVDGITQLQIDTRHGLTFEGGLKSMLRLDPDYLLVGEIRDRESAQAALEAATSGRVLMGTLHSRDTVGVIDSLRNWQIGYHEVAANLELVISQRLVRRLCLDCRQAGPPTVLEVTWLRSLGLRAPKQTWHAAGCAACRYTGYRGRTGVFEIWRKTEADYELILAQLDSNTLRKKLRHRGVKSMLDDGLVKAAEGITSLAELQSIGGQLTA